MNVPGTDEGRVRSLPLRLSMQPDDGGPAHERVLRAPFRLGFGDDCDIKLSGVGGPDVVFQVERARGPLLIASALPPEDFEHYVELRIDGEPLRQPVQELRPGTRLEIVDKAADRHYQVVLEAAVRRWLRPRHLAVAIGVLVIVGSAFGAYLFDALRGTQSEIERTRERVERAEDAIARTGRDLLESVERMGSTDAELASAIRELGALQASASGELRDEFDQRIAALGEQTRAAATQAAEAGSAERREIAAKAKAELDALRTEFSTRMVESYQQLKDVEQRLLASMAARAAPREPAAPDMKQVLRTSREAVLFVRTRYKVRFGPSGETRELSGFGTGFLVGPSGLAVSAQHVMFPWRHDRDLLVLESLGLAEVLTDSVQWAVWPAGAEVLSRADDPESFELKDAYRSDGRERGLRILAVPTPTLAPTAVTSPLGIVELPVPVPGPSDVAVFQIMRFEPGSTHLALPAEDPAIEALDEVLVLGYPYSRLEQGRAWPQGVRGFVRRVAGALLEIDAAVHPGLSGGPLMNARGEVLGMISAIIGSEVYGVAVRARDLRDALDAATNEVLREERRLEALGCAPGPVDGVFDRATYDAYRCAEKRPHSVDAPGSSDISAGDPRAGDD